MNGPAIRVIPDPPPQPRRFELLTADDLAARPPLQWRIKGVLPQTGLAAIIGASGSGKTFLALDAAAAIERGMPWFGCRVRRAPVAYLALEGEAGIANRIAAYQIHTGHRFSEEFRIVAEPFELLSLGDVPALAGTLLESGLAGGVIFVDTLNRAAAGADENASRDMGMLISAATELQIRTAGLVVLVHHTGKDVSKGARGHSSLFAALDACIEVSRTEDRREWRVAKSKDGSDGDAHSFRLEVVELGTDDEGDSVTSCVVAPEERAADALRRVALPGGGNMRLAFDAIAAALKGARAYGMASAPPGRPCIELEAATAAAAAALPCEPKRRRERAQTAITGLVGRGNLGHAEGWIWLS
jgi:hypothetical protein